MTNNFANIHKALFILLLFVSILEISTYFNIFSTIFFSINFDNPTLLLFNSVIILIGVCTLFVILGLIFTLKLTLNNVKLLSFLFFFIEKVTPFL